MDYASAAASAAALPSLTPAAAPPPDPNSLNDFDLQQMSASLRTLDPNASGQSIYERQFGATMIRNGFDPRKYKLPRELIPHESLRVGAPPRATTAELRRRASLWSGPPSGAVKAIDQYEESKAFKEQWSFPLRTSATPTTDYSLTALPLAHSARSVGMEYREPYIATSMEVYNGIHDLPLQASTARAVAEAYINPRHNRSNYGSYNEYLDKSDPLGVDPACINSPTHPHHAEYELVKSIIEGYIAHDRMVASFDPEWSDEYYVGNWRATLFQCVQKRLLNQSQSIRCLTDALVGAGIKFPYMSEIPNRGSSEYQSIWAAWHTALHGSMIKRGQQSNMSNMLSR